MAEPGQNALGLTRKARIRRNCLVAERVSEAILAGLPPYVMDECVADLADAVVAMLLSQASLQADEGQDESSDLREI